MMPDLFTSAQDARQDPDKSQPSLLVVDPRPVPHHARSEPPADPKESANSDAGQELPALRLHSGGERSIDSKTVPIRVKTCVLKSVTALLMTPDRPYLCRGGTRVIFINTA